MTRIDTSTVPPDVGRLPACLVLQDIPLAAKQAGASGAKQEALPDVGKPGSPDLGEHDYGNSIGYFTGYYMGGDTLRLPNTYFENQRQSLWCWIAVASTLGNFYAGGTAYTQTYLYNLMQGTACNVPPMTAPPYSACNTPGDCTHSMQKIGIQGQVFIENPGLTPLLTELLYNRPFVVVLNINADAANQYLHCVVIDAVFLMTSGGYRDEYWSVCDPLETTVIALVSQFPSNYPSQFSNTNWFLTVFSQRPY